MKLTVSRETFLAKLGIAVRGASTRSPIQTLAGVLLKVDDGRAELEATGGLTLEVAAEYAATGVDYLSVGGLTHSSPILDIALDLRP